MDYSENNIFKNESALYPDFLPDFLPGREKEINQLVYCLKPIAQNRQPFNTILIGPPGTGKTSCSKFVLNQLAKQTTKALCVYINCWETPSRSSIFSKLLEELNEVMPRRGISAEELKARFFEITKKENKIPVVILDEADVLLANKEGEKVLYDLCRSFENYSVKSAVIATTNDVLFSAKLDQRIRSSFSEIIKFQPYGLEDLKKILYEREKIAFFEKSLEKEVIPLCAAVAYKRGGDARIALNLLLASARLAEKEGASKVSVFHVKECKNFVIENFGTKAQRKIEDLDELDKKIIEMIKSFGGIESGQLYKTLSSLGKERTIRNRIEKLLKSGLLLSQEVQLKRGKTRLIKIKED